MGYQKFIFSHHKALDESNDAAKEGGLKIVELLGNDGNG
jgi:hypothetical protein